MITIHAWNRVTKCTQVLGAADLESRGPELLAPDETLWIDLDEPTAAEEDLVLRTFFGIHPLSFEDVTRLRREPDAPPHFPKVEEFPDYLFVIVNPLRSVFLDYAGKEIGRASCRERV